MNVYDEESLEELDDEMSLEELGFMQGYLMASAYVDLREE